MKIDIQKKTDQLNFEDFLGGLTRIVTITGVKVGTKEQQYDLELEGDTRVWRPAVTVLKQLALAWTNDGDAWVGRSAELYGDPNVMFGGTRVGGIRVSRVSHIDAPVTANLTETRGKRKLLTMDPLPRVDILRAEYVTADPERREAIKAEVARLSEQPTEAGA